MYVISFSWHSNFDVITCAAILYSKLCHLKDKDTAQLTVFNGERREQDKATNGIKDKKKGSEE
jgi:hypothetical protein